MYQGELNYYTKKIIESCDCLDKHCENPCPLKVVCNQYISEQEREKEKPIWQDFNDKQIELAAQALFEDMLNCNWSLDISERYTDFWTNEQKDAMRQMPPYKQQEIFIDYEDKIKQLEWENSQVETYCSTTGEPYENY